MKNISKSYDETIDILDDILRLDENFDLIGREMIIGGRQAKMYFVDAFCKDEILEKMPTTSVGKIDYEKLKRKNEDIYAEAEKSLKQARKEAKDIVSNVSEIAERLLNELEELKNQKDKKEFSKNFSDSKSRLRADINKLEAMADPVVKKKRGNYKLPRALLAGDSVKVVDIDKEGIVISTADKDGNVFVRVGIMKMRVPLKNLMLLEHS